MIVRQTSWLTALLLVVGISACSTNTYFKEASVGRVDCEEDDMEIIERDEFGTREWLVECPEKKRFHCSGLPGTTVCKPIR